MRGQGGGPKTAQGKAAVRGNAVKHGLRSLAPVVREVERLEDWQRHDDDVIASLEPDGYMESLLAYRIAELTWRLRRVAVYEAERISVDLSQMPGDMVSLARYAKNVSGTPIEESLTPEKVDMQVGIRLLLDDHTIGRITRYEAHLHRQLLQTLHELEALQARRHGERSPLARLDISGPPGS